MAEKKIKSRNVTVKLQYPIPWGEDEVSELTFRPPTAADIEHLSASPTLKELLQIASKCSGQVPALIKKLDATDAIRITEVIADFLDSTPKTGKGNW